MRKLLLTIAIVALLSLSAIGLETYKTPFDFPPHTAPRIGVQRVTNYDPRVNFQHMRVVVYLGPPGPVQFKGAGRGGSSAFYPRATAEIQSTTWYGYPKSKVDINTKDLTPSADLHGVYEAWLVDLDTGYRNSLGTFTAAYGGVGELQYDVNNYLDAYDIIEITAEPYDDSDVLPGPVVLVASIPSTNYFNPEPKSSKMVNPSALSTY